MEITVAKILWFLGTLLGTSFLGWVGYLAKGHMSVAKEAHVHLKSEVKELEDDVQNLDRKLVALEANAITQDELDKFKSEIKGYIDSNSELQAKSIDQKLAHSVEITNLKIDGAVKELKAVIRNSPS